jgi:FixJ family two-component response regulator
MPGFDGSALQETLAQTLPYLSVVFITGRGDIPMTVKAIRGGAVDFLEKLVDDEALLEAVRRAAERNAKRHRALRLTTFNADISFLRPANARCSSWSPPDYSTNKGAELGTGEKPIKVHRARVVFKDERRIAC